MSHVSATFATAKPVAPAVERKCFAESRLPRGIPHVSANMHSTVWTSWRSRKSLAASTFSLVSATVITLPLVGAAEGGYRSALVYPLHLASPSRTRGHE